MTEKQMKTEKLLHYSVRKSEAADTVGSPLYTTTFGGHRLKII